MNKRKQRTTQLTVLLILFILISGGMGGWAYMETGEVKEKKVTIKKLEEDNSMLKKEVAKLEKQLSALSTENDSLLDVRGELQAEVDQLKEQVRSKRMSVNQILAFKRKRDQLRGQIRKLEEEIESMKQTRQQLQATNKTLRDSNQMMADSAQSLEQMTQKMRDSISDASVIRAYGYQFTLYKTNLFGNYKTTDEADDVERIEGCFTLEENALADTGKKMLYMRVLQPNGEEVTRVKDETTLFQFNDSEGHYTKKEEITYSGEAMDYCMRYDLSNKDKELRPGRYTAELYMDKRKVGETTFRLKD